MGDIDAEAAFEEVLRSEQKVLWPDPSRELCWNKVVRKTVFALALAMRK
jgi:hypothetical protein